MPPRSAYREQGIAQVSAALGVTVDEVVDALSDANDDLVLAAEALGGDPYAIFGPSGRPSRQVRRAFGHGYTRTYAKRTAAHPEMTAREAAGHYRYEPGAVRVATFFAVAEGGGVELIRVDGISAADERRAGIYMHSVRGLVNNAYRLRPGAILRGEAAKRHFRNRFRAWRPIAGRRVAFDPDAVLAAADAAAAAGIVIAFVSPKRRRSRRGRS